MIKTVVGPMHSAKTAALLQIYHKIWNKKHVMCFKPEQDTRDYGMIRSNDYPEGIPAICINNLSEIKNYITDDIKNIFIDEAQMLEGDVRELTALSILDDIDIYIAGLNQTSEQQPFGIMPYILAVSNDIELIKASCFDCGKHEAYYTYYDGVKTSEILAGDEGYIPLCTDCLRKKRTREEFKLILKSGYNKKSR